MAFNAANWGVISSSANTRSTLLQNGTRQGAPGVYTYQSQAELRATIAGANYFANVANTLAPGDLILVVGSDGSAIYYVTAVNVGATGSTITIA